MAKKRIKYSDKVYPKINPHIVARSLRASAVYPFNPSGLEIVFSVPVQQVQRGENDGIHVVDSGVVFPAECLVGYDIDRSMIFLSEDYEAWYNLSTNMVLFMSSAPSRPQIRVRINKITSINKLPSGLNLLPLIY